MVGEQLDRLRGTGARGRARTDARWTGRAGARAVAARSAESTFGLGFCHRSTATRWRSTSRSACFEVNERANSVIQPDWRTNIR